MPVIHEFDPPERFVAGTVGEPGGRTFFLQARSGPRMVSVALEKQQVAVLAERIDELLDEVMASTGNDTLIPAVAPMGLDDSEPLEQPIDWPWSPSPSWCRAPSSGARRRRGRSRSARSASPASTPRRL